VKPVSADSGSFEYDYAKPGESSVLKGEMTGNKITKLQKWGTREQNMLRDMLEKDPQFQALNNQTLGKNFSRMDTTFQFPVDNKSSFKVEYKNELNQTENITGKIDFTGTVTELRLASENNDGSWWPWVLFALVLALALHRLLRKLSKKNLAPAKLDETGPFDYPAHAKRLLKKARRTYSKGNRREAYSIVSEALRLYFKHVLKSPDELTDLEVVRMLERGDHAKTELTAECLNLCGLIKFARYKPGKEDFTRIIDLAERIVE